MDVKLSKIGGIMTWSITMSKDSTILWQPASTPILDSSLASYGTMNNYAVRKCGGGTLSGEYYVTDIILQNPETLDEAIATDFRNNFDISLELKTGIYTFKQINPFIICYAITVIFTDEDEGWNFFVPQWHDDISDGPKR
ncbi:hypothetical protein CHS0354_024381 [Potamilus streckersoni]|uniref:Uncharacterized protein n=1 Tax=Potamilus streckersoni TaxID=2493646 RepID=A0AAE0W2V5_9BIVA|nr:hypothetical protein CHS0354_024381 [Potamilus streckersoni]